MQPRMCALAPVGQDTGGARGDRGRPGPDVSTSEMGLLDAKAVPLRENKNLSPLKKGTDQGSRVAGRGRVEKVELSVKVETGG